MSSLVIRRAVPADVDAVASVYVHSSRDTYTGIYPDHVIAAMSVDERARRWRETFAQAGPNEAVHVCCEPGGDIVGFGECGAQRSLSLAFAGEVYCVYVLARAQRRGAGRRLMGAMAHFLLSRGMTSASLWVARDNAKARAFYETLGGVVVAEKQDVHQNFTLHEVAYGWHHLCAGRAVDDPVDRGRP